jgi:hypothetical protein
MAIHHVHVDQIRAAALRGRHRVAECGEIRRQQRRRDLESPCCLHQRLTSREMGSLRPI